MRRSIVTIVTGPMSSLHFASRLPFFTTRHVAICLVMLVIGGSAQALVITQITDNSLHDAHPAISGSNVVWTTQVTPSTAGEEIFFWDGSTTTRLTNNSTQDAHAAISGTSVVWNSSGGILHWNGSTTTTIATNGGSPRISGSNVVWQARDGTVNDDHEIYLWDGTSTTQLTHNIILDLDADISGSNVVWRNSAGGDAEIYFWDGSTTTQITNNAFDDWYPVVSGPNVAWYGYTTNPFDHQIYFWDGSTITQITSDGTSYNPDISGSNVVWDSGGDIYLWDGSATTQITSNGQNSRPAISGNNVVWYGWDGNDYEIYMAIIPEPSTGLLCMTGLVSLAMRRRQRLG